MSSRRGWRLLGVGLLILTAMAGCARQSSVVDLTDTGGGTVADAAASAESFYGDSRGEYTFRPGDKLEVRFVSSARYNYETMVTSSGTVTVPSGGEVMAVGKTASELTAAIDEKMSTVLQNPAPAVTLKELGQQFIFVLGEVGGPGRTQAVPNMTVSMALGATGGVRPTGKAGSVIVLRTYGVPQPTAYRVDMRKVFSGEDLSQDIRLVPNDVIYVPKRFIANVGDFVELFFNRIAPVQTFYLRGYDMMHLEFAEWRW